MLTDAGQEVRDELDRRAQTIFTLTEALAAERALADDLAAAADVFETLGHDGFRHWRLMSNEGAQAWRRVLDALARHRAARTA